MHTCFSHVLRYHRTFFHVESNSRVHCALEKLIQDLGQKTKFIYYYMSVQLKVHSLLRIAFCVTWKFLVFTVEQRFKKRLIAHELLLLNRSLQVFFFLSLLFLMAILGFLRCQFVNQSFQETKCFHYDRKDAQILLHSNNQLFIESELMFIFLL